MQAPASYYRLPVSESNTPYARFVIQKSKHSQDVKPVSCMVIGLINCSPGHQHELESGFVFSRVMIVHNISLLRRSGAVSQNLSNTGCVAHAGRSTLAP